MNNLQKILSKAKENSCNPNRESMILDYVLTMLRRGDSLDTINEVANLLRRFDNKEIEKLDNPITGAFLAYHGFTSKCGNNYYEILIKNKHYFSITQIIQEDGFVENNIGFRDVKDNNEIFIDYTELKTEKQLINLIQTLFGVTLTKKQ